MKIDYKINNSLHQVSFCKKEDKKNISNEILTFRCASWSHNFIFAHISNEILTLRRASWFHNFIFTYISNEIAPFPGSNIRGLRVERSREQDSQIRRALGPRFLESRKHWDAEIRTADIRTMHRSLTGRPQNVLHGAKHSTVAP